MNQKIMYLFTRTPLHIGAGSSVGAIDSPIQRERHTGFPIIPGSAIKGVLADGYLEVGDTGKMERNQDGNEIFGDTDTANESARSGSISFGEGKLFAFPVRSAKGCFAWLTSPLILKRLARDTGRTIDSLPEPAENQVFCDAGTLGKTSIFEDYAFECAGLFPVDLKDLISDQVWHDSSEQHLALISDEWMSNFARTATKVDQHVKIDDDTGVAVRGALFNQECVPSETLFYSVLTELRASALEKLSVPPVLQIGGDATTGLGYCSVEVK